MPLRFTNSLSANYLKKVGQTQGKKFVQSGIIKLANQKISNPIVRRAVGGFINFNGPGAQYYPKKTQYNSPETYAPIRDAHTKNTMRRPKRR